MKFDNRPNRLLIDLYRKSIFIYGNRLIMVPDTFELRISNNIERELDIWRILVEELSRTRFWTRGLFRTL